MGADMPFWENLERVTFGSRVLGLVALVAAAAIGFAVWKINQRKQELEAYRDGPRHVPPRLVQQLQVWLEPHHHTIVQVLHVANDQEGATFRDELSQVFNAAGWVVNPGGAGQFGLNYPWTKIEVVYYRNDVEPAAKAAVRVIARLGFTYRETPVHLAQGGPFNPGTVVIRIGQR